MDANRARPSTAPSSFTPKRASIAPGAQGASRQSRMRRSSSVSQPPKTGLGMGMRDRRKTGVPWADVCRQYCPDISDVVSFKRARQALREYGPANLLFHFKNVVDEDGLLAVGPDAPPNFYAQIAAGIVDMPAVARERQLFMGRHGKEFMMLNPLKEHEDQSISERHELMILKRDLHWQWFNILTFGLVEDGASIQEAIAKVERMQDAVAHYTKSSQNIWSENIGVYFECYPYCSVLSFHVHVIDLDRVGSGFPDLIKRSVSIDDVLTVLRSDSEANNSAMVPPVIESDFIRKRSMTLHRSSILERDRIRRGRLYSLEPQPWKRTTPPLDRLKQRMAESGRTFSSPLLT